MTISELVVTDLKVNVGGRRILDGIDLTVRSGEVHAIMGPNGAGKSTLSHVLMGRPGYEVVGGSVTLDGRDLLSMATWQRARGGLFLASQQPTEIPGVSLEDIFSNALFDEDHRSALSDSELRERVAAEGSTLGLGTRILDRAVNVGLSGGERKRSETLQLAVLRPRICILDELDSGLDVDGLRTVAQRVQAAVGEWGLGVLAITHYRRLLDVLIPGSVHVLVHGRIVASGGPEMAEELERTGYGEYVD